MVYSGYEIDKEWFSDSDKFIKAKLIIEIPEKKIEITESEFDRAVDVAKNWITDDSYEVNIEDLKEILGF